MGLIRAAAGAAGSTMADQWKEFFYCEAMDKEVMVVKGTKRTSSRSSNKRGSDNIITSGSGIAVADGQCMMIVEQGKVVDICADPGEYTYDASTEPSIFAGSLGEGIRSTFQTIGKRFAYGGDTGKDQRVYYFNTKELVDNKFGTPTPIPFRVVDSRIGLDIDVSVRCHGVYSYRIADPLLFYTNVCGNVEQEYTREELDSQLKTEFVSALQPAFGRLSELELRPNQIVTHNTELENAMNEVLSAKWEQLRGLKVVSVALGSVTLPDEDAERQMYWDTETLMEKNGYHRYEISNYAKEGYACRHNLGYWERIPYLGFGIGAASLVPGELIGKCRKLEGKMGRYTNPDQLREYAHSYRNKFQAELLTETEEMEEFMFLGLRKMDGISKKEFSEYFGKSLEDIYGEAICKLESLKLLEQDDDRVWLTKRGIDVSNSVFVEFLLEG